jgi:hypothetical protein
MLVASSQCNFSLLLLIYLENLAHPLICGRREYVVTGKFKQSVSIFCTSLFFFILSLKGHFVTNICLIWLLLVQLSMEEWKERHPESGLDISDKFLNLRFVSLEVCEHQLLVSTIKFHVPLEIRSRVPLCFMWISWLIIVPGTFDLNDVKRACTARNPILCVFTSDQYMKEHFLLNCIATCTHQSPIMESYKLVIGVDIYRRYSATLVSG